ARDKRGVPVHASTRAPELRALLEGYRRKKPAAKKGGPRAAAKSPPKGRREQRRPAGQAVCPDSARGPSPQRAHSASQQASSSSSCVLTSSHRGRLGCSGRSRRGSLPYRSLTSPSAGLSGDHSVALSNRGLNPIAS